MAKKAYFIGIAGKAMGALAKAFKDLGWEVSGSDHKGVYPPISTYLQENGISYTEGYRAENVPSAVDLIVVGRSALMVDPQNPEFLEAQKRKCPVLSYPEALQQYLIKENSLVVAGTYGKTTITGVLVSILTAAGLNPSYMIGGVPIGMKDGVKITDSQYSVVEGDEPPALRETDLPKFMFYRPKFLLLTATKHDHPEIYPTPESYREAFLKLVKLLPPEGILVYNLHEVDSLVVVAFKGLKVSYSLNDSRADWHVENVKKEGSKTFFRVVGKKELALETSLLGRFNLENLCGAVALAEALGIESEVIARGIADFQGIKTRLEFLGSAGGRFCYWDFAQHPAKVKGSLEAIREHYPHQRITAVFDPAMTGLKHRESLAWYPGAFDAANQVIVGRVSFLKNIAKADRVTGPDLVAAIAKTQPAVFYEPRDEEIINYLIEKTKPGEVIIFMSSGGLRFVNLIKKVINKLKNIKTEG